jgi:dTDP-4-dehydrorhamnose reductase
MRLIVTGTSGQVVSALVERGAARGVAVRPIGRPALDLADAGTIRSALAEAAGDVVVSAAAYTAVDKAESEFDLAMRINGAGAGHVARAAARLGLPVIHLSTDYVFDGSLDRPYREDDAPNPASAYGRSKLAGEAAVAAGNPAHVILRTSWVYSPFGQNFLKTMLRLGRTRDEVSVVADQYGTPTGALDIADGVIAIARKIGERPGDTSLRGTFHMAGTGEATWADLAEAIFTDAAALGRRPVAVRRIATVDYPTPARRPANSRLDAGKLARSYGVVLPCWRASVRACVARLAAES